MKSQAQLLPTKSNSFVGFPRRYNYTNTPDIAFDLFPHLLTGAEIKVLDYIFRRSTLGDRDVSTKQMISGLVTKEGKRLDFGSGVKSHNTVIKALKKLKELALISTRKNTGYDGRDLANIFTLKYSAEGLEEPRLLQSYIENSKTPTAENFKFEGFLLPTFTPIPDDVYDIFPHVLSHRAYLIVRYVCRHTFGWKKRVDQISLTQMMNGIVSREGERVDYGCGIKRKASIVKGIKEAEELGILVVERRKKDSGANATTTYGLKFREENDSSTPSAKLKPSLCKIETTPSAKLKPPLCKIETHNTTEEQYTDQQNTEEQQQRRSRKQTPKKQAAQSDSVVVAFLREQGFSRQVAEKLANGCELAYVQQKVEYRDFALDTTPDRISNPLGWLRIAIEEDFGEPSGFKTRQERERESAEAEQKRAQVEAEQSAWQQAQADELAAKERERQTIFEQYQTEYGTTSADVETWQRIKKSLMHMPYYSRLLDVVEGLKVGADGAVILGVHNQPMLEIISHPNTFAGLKRDLGFELERSDVDVELVLLRPNSTVENTS